MTEGDSSRVRRLKSGELWSTNNTALHVDSDEPKLTFSEDHISARIYRGSCRLKFLHTLENDQGLAAHTPLETGVPQQFLRATAVPAGTAEARISYGDSVRLCVSHKPVPNQAQVR